MKLFFVIISLILIINLNLLAQENTQNNASLETKKSNVVETSIDKNSSPEKNNALVIAKFESSPMIDGNLNEEVWKKALLISDFKQVQPKDNAPPTHPTEVLLGYDAKNLYVAFRVKQDRDKIRATIARRDQIFNDDYIGIALDTFNDQRKAYMIFFNPLGIQADGVLTDGDGEDYSLDLVFESKGVLTDDGYTIEVAIPFKSLRYEAGKNKLWGIHLYRRIKYANNELDSWKMLPRGATTQLDKTGKITGLEGISTTRQLEIIPSLTLSQSGRRTRHTFDNNPDGRYVNDHIKPDFGLTAKFSLTPTITLDFAYNPDFAQVEADAPVTTANQSFPIFFAEKRPFFLERIDIFQTAMNVVNTRAIVDPDIAAKLTGRRGKNTFGFLYASDNAPGNYSLDERENLKICQREKLTNPNTICGIEKFVDKNANIGILRFKRDIGRQNHLGFLATAYSFPENRNYTAGIDGRFRVGSKMFTAFQITGTNTKSVFYNPYEDREVYRTGNGFGYNLFAERSSRNLYMNFVLDGRTRDYRAKVGFTERTDTNYAGSFIKYETERDTKSKIIFKRITNNLGANYDWKGRLQQWRSNTQGMLALQKQTFVGGGITFGYERIFEHEFGRTRTPTRTGTFYGNDNERSANSRELYAFLETQPNGKISANTVISYTFGALDYDFGAGKKFPRVSPAALLNPDNPLDPGAGNQLFIEAGLQLQPTSAFQTRFDYKKIRLVRNDTVLTAFDDNIFSSRSVYQFTRNIFARFRLDYSTLSTRVRPQLVFGWTPNPGTAFYVGYNDDINYRGFNPYTGRPEQAFQGNGRTFFIKASYLFKKSF